MDLNPSTIRWKLNNDSDSLTPTECDYLSDLVTEKLGYQAPDLGATLTVVPPHISSKKETPDGDPYKEIFAKSPNQGGTIKPKFIVIHDSYGSHDGTKSWILQRRSRVSYHYLIATNGNRTQFVGDTKRAWHAGSSYWKGYNGLNAHSIGVAFWGNTYERTPSFKEIDSCARKIIYLMEKFSLSIDSVVTHKQIAPKRKNDTSPKTMERVLARVQKLINK